MRLPIIAAGVYVLVRICDKIGVVVFAVILALFLTAVLHPLEKRLRAALRGPKSLPALLAVLAGIAALGEKRRAQRPAGQADLDRACTRVAIALDRPAQEALADVQFAVLSGALPAFKGGQAGVERDVNDPPER